MTCPCEGRGFVELRALEAYSVHFDAKYHYKPADGIKRYPQPSRRGGRRNPRTRSRIRWRIVTFKAPCECAAASAWVASHASFSGERHADRLADS